MKKKRLAVVVLTSFLLVGCADNVMSAIYDDDSKIAINGNSFSYYNGIAQSVEDSTFTASVHGMDGMDTVWEYDAKSDSEIQVDFELFNQVGDVKLVLISPDGELETIIESTEEEAIEGSQSFDIKKGDNRIKIVSRDKAEFDLKLKIDGGEFQELSF